jgi:TolB protein
VNSSGGGDTRLTFNGTYNARGVYAPKGNKIALLHREGEQYNIATMDLRNGSMTTLTRDGMDESPSFAPNGRMLLYASLANGKRVLGMISIDGKVAMQLPAPEGDVDHPAWSPYLRK